jgi:hypothetical protein
MTKIDIVPTKELDFQQKVKNVISVCRANAENWGMDYDAIDRLESEFGPLDGLIATCHDPSSRTPALVAEKNERKAEFIPLFRKFNTLELRPRSAVIGAEGWVLLGLPAPRVSRGKRAVGSPTASVTIDVTAHGKHSLAVSIQDSVSGKTRPDSSIKFTMIRYEIMDEAPESPKGLGEIHLERGKVMRKTFSPKDSGRRVFFSAGYVNSKGEIGEFCKPVEAVIP